MAHALKWQYQRIFSLKWYERVGASSEIHQFKLQGLYV